MADEIDKKIMQDILKKTYEELRKKNRGEITQSKLKSEIINMVKEEVKTYGN